MNKPLQFPFGGLSEDLAFTNQSDDTTPDTRNMRAIDPETGRTRGGQRAGIGKLDGIDTSLGTGKVQDLNSIVTEVNQLTYTNLAADEITKEWSLQTPSGEPVYALALDIQENVYAIDGASSIAKYNSEGKFLYSISAEIKDSSHILRTIYVDEGDNIYVAVSTGGDSKKARIFRYRQSGVEDAELDWFIEPGGFVTRLEVQGNRLYCCVNDPSANRSTVRVYRNINLSEPTLQWSEPAAYPVHGLCVKKDGSVITTSPPFADRGKTPEQVNLAPSSIVGWTPLNLDDADKRIWSWFKAEDLVETHENGDPVNVWPDAAGKNRSLFKIAGIPAPTFRTSALGDRPSVYFTGGDAQADTPAVTSGQMLACQRSYSSTQGGLDSQRGAIPSYEGDTTDENSMFALFILARIKKDSAAEQVLCSQAQAVQSTADEDWAITCNREAANALNTNAPGVIAIYEDTDAATDVGHGTDGHPDHVYTGAATGDTPNADNTLSTVLITYINDGGTNTGDLDETATHSMLRVNGTPIDRWVSHPFYTNSVPSQFVLGGHAGADAAELDATSTLEAFEGEILEMLCLTRTDHSTSLPSASILLTHENFGNDVAGDAGEDAAWADQADNELTKIEGYLMHKAGAAGLLPVNASSNHGHPFSDDAPVVSGEADPNDIGTVNSVTAKYEGANGKLIWTELDKPGQGYECKVSQARDPYTGEIYEGSDSISLIGPVNSLDIANLDHGGGSYILDDGDVATSLYTDRWDITDYEYQFPTLALDEFSGVLRPMSAQSASANAYTFNHRFLTNSFSSASNVDYEEVSGTEEQAAYVVRCVQSNPDYGDDITETLRRPETVYVGLNNVDTGSGTGLDTLIKYRLVSAVARSPVVSPRSVVTIGVCDGIVKKYTSSAVTTPTNNASNLETNARYISSVEAHGRIFFSDGVRYLAYNPKTDEVDQYTATTGGKIPRHFELLSLWRGRVVFLRGSDSAANQDTGPQGWFMTAVNLPYDADLFPAAPSAGQAMAGSLSLAGAAKDIINTFVPYNDDLCFFGGDKSIYRMSGDPLQGGQFDLISDVTGMSYGRPWAKDPVGRVYFYGSKGGVYVITPSGEVDRISLRRIERKLQNIDLSLYYARMEWDYDAEGLRLFFMPFGTSQAATTHFFFDAKTGGWWEDDYANTDHRPSAIHLVDGDDPSDRFLHLGCFDAKVRKIHRDYDDDDGTAIDSYVTYGPFFYGDAKVGLSRLQIELADDQAGCVYTIHGGSNPDTIGDPIATGTLAPGRNPFKSVRARDRYLWLRLRNASANQRWAFERGMVELSAAGGLRV